MRIPIAYGLAYPDRIESGAKPLNLATEQCLEFNEPDLTRFPCLGLGIEAAKSDRNQKKKVPVRVPKTLTDLAETYSPSVEIEKSKSKGKKKTLKSTPRLNLDE